MPRARLLAPTAVLLAVALCGCTGPILHAGPHVTRTRPIGAFDRVAVDGSAAVVVRRGAAAGRLTISGNRRRVADLTTRVVVDTLVVAPRSRSGVIDLAGGSVTVTADAPSLRGAQVNGSGRVRASGLSGGRFDASVRGSGEVDARGHVRALAATIDGSGRIGAGRLTARAVAVAVSGSGRADVDARARLEATVRGRGHVRYRGRPDLTRVVDGSGGVSPR